MSMRLLIATVVLTAACVLFPLSIAISADFAPVDSRLLQEITDAAREREALFDDCVDEAWVHTQNWDKGSSVEKSRILATPTEFLNESTTDWQRGNRAWQTRMASLSQGSKFTLFDDKPPRGPVALIRPRGEGTVRGRRKRFLLTSFGVRHEAFLLSELLSSDTDSLWSQLPRSNPQRAPIEYNVEDLGEEIVDGRKCRKLRMSAFFGDHESGRRHTLIETDFSLDPSLGWAPVAMERREISLAQDPTAETKGVVTHRDEVQWSDFREHLPGVWLPLRTHAVYTNVLRQGATTTIEIERTRLGFPASIPSEMFKIDLPPGTQVDDRVAGIAYRTPERPTFDESLFDDFDAEELPDPIDPTSATAPPPSEKPDAPAVTAEVETDVEAPSTGDLPAKPPGPLAFVLPVVLIALLLLVIVVARRR